MSANNESLRKWIQAARKAPPPTPAPPDSPAPFGFSTRVAARWTAARGRSGRADAWERLSLWGASASVALCVMAFVGQSFQQEANPFDSLIDTPADPLEMM
jgi:anti-sigma-K factor RskA